MERLKSISKAAMLSVVLLLLILANLHPTFALAASDGSGDSGSGLTNTTSSTTPTSPSPNSSPTTGPTSSTGPSQPTGPSADTFTYDPTTGLWINAYYSWNPVTYQTEPLTPQTYSYNPATGMWDTTQWVFDAATGQYEPNVVTVTQPPAGAVTTTAPTTTDSSSNNPTDNSSTDPSSVNVVAPDTSGTISTTGPGSTNNNDASSNSNNIFGLFYNANISNAINETGQSGNATIDSNTLAGNATSGNVLDIANVVNLLQSSATGMSTFVANINGDVAGNILLDPSTIIQPGIDSSNSNQTSSNTTNQLNSTNNNSINNNVNLNANSGNASVTNNSSAGNATSGNAAAVADIVNLIDSEISSGQSFLGVININGNLDGNILLPPNFVNTLLASNAASDPVNTTNGNTSTTINNVNNDTINNAVTNTTNTGTAAVSNNTSAGNATSGNATNQLTILNLTGSQIIGSNDLLVFVNVLGTWVGVIMNAPAGTTAAELGGGITNNSTNSTNNTTTANITNNNTINNNINDNASTGNANVSNNTSGGNATSGNASASANLLNLIDSQLSVSNWFGILFINVFGTWNGSLAEETLPPPANTLSPPAASTTTPVNNNYVVLYKSDPKSNSSGYNSGILANTNTSNTGGTHNLSGHVLVSSNSKPNNPTSNNLKNHKSTSSVSYTALFIGFSGIILLGAERIWESKKKNTAQLSAEVS